MIIDDGDNMECSECNKIIGTGKDCNTCWRYNETIELEVDDMIEKEHMPPELIFVG